MRLAAAALAALLLAAPASATSFTDCFDPISTEVNERIAALPVLPETKEEKAELKALLAVRKVLDKEYKTLNVGVDAKNAARIAKTLLKAYPEDAEIATLLDGMIDCLEGVCNEEHGILQGLITALPEGKKRVGLENGHNTLDEKLDVLAGLTDTTERARSLGPIARGLVALRKKFVSTVSSLAGKPGVTAVIGALKYKAEEFEGSINLVSGEDAVASVAITATYVVPVIVETRTLTINIGGVVGGTYTEPGTYDLEGLPISLSYATLGGPNPPVLLNANAGTLVLVELDLGTGTAAGTFEGTALDDLLNPVPFKVKFHVSGLNVVAP